MTTMVIDNAETVAAVIGERLTISAFEQLSGSLSGHPFVKVVV
jgi:hypothetical protein